MTVSVAVPHITDQLEAHDFKRNKDTQIVALKSAEIPRFFYVLLTVHLSIILVIDQLNA